MLYRKTTTAFSAVILGVMALLGATAHAQINLNAAGTAASPIGTAVFSKESLPRPAARQTVYAVRVPAASQSALILQAQLGTLIARGASRTDGIGGLAVRLDFANMEFVRPLLATHLVLQPAGGGTAITTTDGPRSLSYGGTANDGSNPRCNGKTCAIFEVDATSADIPATTLLQWNSWNGYYGVAANGGGMARVRVYSNVDNALAVASISDESFVGLRSDTGAKLAVDVKSSVTTVIRPGARPAVADVAAMPRFTDFTPSGRNPLGTITTTLNKTHFVTAADLADAKQVSALDDVMDTANSGIVLTDTTDNLGFGTFTLHPGTDCSGTAGGVSVPTEGDNAGRGVAGIAEGTRTLCVAPRTTATSMTPAAERATAPNHPIPATAISASVTYAAVTGNGFSAMDMAGPVGSIERNGATVQISYLTVSDRYNQRIIITNRSGTDAEYELTNFYTEDGTEGSGGEGSMGTVPMNSSIVVLTRDAVQFTGSRSRGSATLAVTAPAATISVATTQVNLSDGSTDTVNYDVTGAGQ